MIYIGHASAWFVLFVLVVIFRVFRVEGKFWQLALFAMGISFVFAVPSTIVHTVFF